LVIIDNNIGKDVMDFVADVTKQTLEGGGAVKNQVETVEKPKTISKEELDYYKKCERIAKISILRGEFEQIVTKWVGMNEYYQIYKIC